MKSRTTCILTYLAALAIGVLLLIFTGHNDLFKTIVIIIGALVILPSVIAIVYSWIPARNAAGLKVPRPWYISFAGIAGLIFGVLLLCIPSFFASYIVYTLGFVLIISGLMQIIYLSATASLFGISKLYYIVPWVTFACGIFVIILGPKYINDIVTVITGIFLVCYSINGFTELMSESKKTRAVRRM